MYKLLFNKLEISPEERKVGKLINHSIIYGVGNEKLKEILRNNNLPIKLIDKIKEFKNVFHIADIHLRLTKRHDEYVQVFERLYKAIEKTPTETVVAVLGDVLHSKSDLSPECVKITTEFLQNLADRRPTVLIAGNHDMVETNKSDKDRISIAMNFSFK